MVIQKAENKGADISAIADLFALTKVIFQLWHLACMFTVTKLIQLIYFFPWVKDRINVAIIQNIFSS